MDWEEPPPGQAAGSRWPLLAGLALLVTGFVLAVVWQPQDPSRSPDAIPVGQASRLPAAPTEQPAASPGTPTTPEPGTTGSAAPTPAVTHLEPRPLLSGNTGLTLVIGRDGGGTAAVDADTGVLTELASGLEQIRDIVPLEDGRVVAAGYGPGAPRAVLLYPEAPGRSIRLGQADRALRSEQENRVWLFDSTGGVRATRAEEVSLSGAPTVEAYVQLPRVTRPVGAVGGGLAVDTAGHFVLFDAGTDTGRSLGHGVGVAAGGGRVARLTCDEDLRCELAVGPVGDPDAVRVPAPDGLSPTGVWQPGSFSPDGQFLAVTVLEQMNAREGLQPGILLLDTSSGRSKLLSEPSSLSLFGVSAPVWSPSGRWLFYPGESGVLAYSTVTGELQLLELPGLRRITVVAVL